MVFAVFQGRGRVLCKRTSSLMELGAMHAPSTVTPPQALIQTRSEGVPWPSPKRLGVGTSIVWMNPTRRSFEDGHVALLNVHLSVSTRRGSKAETFWGQIEPRCGLRSGAVDRVRLLTVQTNLDAKRGIPPQ